MNWGAFGFTFSKQNAFSSREWVEGAFGETSTSAQRDMVAALMTQRGLKPAVHRRFQGLILDGFKVQDRHRESKGAYSLVIAVLKDPRASKQAEKALFDSLTGQRTLEEGL